jgi:hypothetical protein
MNDPEYHQCIMPVFEDLLPAPHDAVIQDLLYVLASWHGVAKLRMHTATTLQTLEELTSTFGTLLRRFSAQTSATYTTFELPREAAARARRRTKRKTNEGGGLASESSHPPKNAKHFNLTTYKLHAMGDYVNTIRKYGTVDSYSTQLVRYADILDISRPAHDYSSPL